MKLLSIDSSSSVVSVAMVAEGRLLFGENTPHARSDSSPLFRSLESAVATQGRPDALCVGLGPGSYNGIRAAISAARAMASALGIPLHGIPSPLGIPGPSTGFQVAGDARGGHFWLARLENGVMTTGPLLVPNGDLAATVAERPDLPCLAVSPLQGIDAEIVTPEAALLAGVALRSDPFYRCHATPEPLYLKPPHITTPRNHTLSA